MTADDMRLIKVVSEYLVQTMHRYRSLSDALQEPRTLDTAELERRLHLARDERDLRDIQAIERAIGAGS